MRERIMISLCSALVGLTIGSGILFSTNESQAKSKDALAPVATNLNCPKCSGVMEFGYSLDYFDGGSSGGQSEWAAKLRGLSPFKRNPPSKKVITYRCMQCGYLESYAK